MRELSRRSAIGVLAVGGVLGLGLAGGYMLRDAVRASRDSNRGAAGQGTLGGVMGGVSAGDMSTYMDLFDRHTHIHRTVEVVPGGVRTLTEADSQDLVALLQAHVGSMYAHLDHGTDVTCMSNSLPTLFRDSGRYRRALTLTAKGVAVTEISDDPRLTAAIRAHAGEVTGFVADGMPAMMRGMIGGQGMTR